MRGSPTSCHLKNAAAGDHILTRVKVLNSAATYSCVQSNAHCTLLLPSVLLMSPGAPLSQRDQGDVFVL